jgi:hypothetical protein
VAGAGKFLHCIPWILYFMLHHSETFLKYLFIDFSLLQITNSWYLKIIEQIVSVFFDWLLNIQTPLCFHIPLIKDNDSFSAPKYFPFVLVFRQRRLPSAMTTWHVSTRPRIRTLNPPDGWEKISWELIFQISEKHKDKQVSYKLCICIFNILRWLADPTSETGHACTKISWQLARFV